ncbi:MAG TPA: response regulator [Isosphaeraceae bacterium]|jgi:CheY-like chemotaxis protein|nr:response regulator [Isosphaeraceae bacterium]
MRTSDTCDHDRSSAGGTAPEPADARRATGPILVVDDNATTACGMAMLLELSGHEVEVAHDGPAALELAGTRPPRAALLDLTLPGIDGFEVARRLRAAAGSRPLLLVAVTGRCDDDVRRTALDAGFDDFLAKPVDIDALVRLLAAAR